jgi:IS6 family transposase
VPILNRRLGGELPATQSFWRLAENDVRVASQWKYLYRAVIVAERDLTAAKLILRLALSGSGGVRPRVVNVDGHPAYARALAELKDSRHLGRCLCRPYLI